MEDERLKYWLALNKINGLGPARFKKLITYFKNAKNAWLANTRQYQEAGLDNKTAEIIDSTKTEIDPDNLLADLKQHSLQATCWIDDNYPTLLKEIYDPPPVLYFKGNIKDIQIPLAIVGTRKISTYGRQIVKDLIPALVRQQITTVSGMALGVDALVHEETLQTNGRTIAVLGSGLDQQNIYPSSNRYLAEKIVKAGGCLISEYTPGTLPLKQHFPKRNRIISGLSRGVLVIEGGEESGSLITASCALDHNREILAVPGSIYANNSRGPNRLIKQGAKVVSSISDILECLELQSFDQEIKEIDFQLTEQEQRIFDLLSSEGKPLDDIIRQSKLPTAQVTSTLSLLEMKNLVKNLSNNIFVKTRTL